MREAGMVPRAARARSAALAGAAVIGLAGCENLPLAMGDVQAIVVGASPELWAEVGDTAFEALEGSVFTVRDDHAFRVTYAEPVDSAWAGLRRLRQLLLIGKASDPWMSRSLELSDAAPNPPEVLQVTEVWAREQLVTMLVLEEDADLADDVRTVTEMLPELFGLFNSQYREWAVARMFATARDTALARTLRDEHGFYLIVPEVYDYQVQDSVHIFRNDNPNPSELIRQFAITWRTPVPESVGTDEILAWRTGLAEQYYDYPQIVARDIFAAGAAEFGDWDAYSVQGVWENPPGAYPAAGPFISRAITCAGQERMYLVDAWLYAPSRDKYEYMIQLDEILNSFRCVE